MSSTKTSYEQTGISRPAFVSLVKEMIGGKRLKPFPDDPTPPGPWDPYIRQAINRVSPVLDPSSIPWLQVFGPLPDPWIQVALNPQPLPPRAVFSLALAQEVISRVELVQEIADAMTRDEQPQGIIIVGGILSRFVDDCGNDRVWRKRPFPPPPHAGDDKLTGLELVVMGAQFEQSALTTFNERLQHEFRRTGERLIELGVARM